jgi:hypothetical protein
VGTEPLGISDGPSPIERVSAYRSADDGSSARSRASKPRGRRIRRGEGGR